MPWPEPRRPLARRRNSARLARRRPRLDPTQPFAGVFDRAIDVDFARRNFVHLAAVGTINLQCPPMTPLSGRPGMEPGLDDRVGRSWSPRLRFPVFGDGEGFKPRLGHSAGFLHASRRLTCRVS
jgi:hypothetical protein